MFESGDYKYKHRTKNKKIAIIVSISGIVGATIGAEFSSYIDVKNLKTLFGIFLIIIAIFEIYSLINKAYKNKKSK